MIVRQCPAFRRCFLSVNSVDGGFTDGGIFMLTVNEDQVIRSGKIISSLLDDDVADENNDMTSHQPSMLDAPVCPMPAAPEGIKSPMDPCSPAVPLDRGRLCKAPVIDMPNDLGGIQAPIVYGSTDVYTQSTPRPLLTPRRVVATRDETNQLAPAQLISTIDTSLPRLFVPTPPLLPTRWVIDGINERDGREASITNMFRQTEVQPAHVNPSTLTVLDVVGHDVNMGFADVNVIDSQLGIAQLLQ
jgi:hypothetical protein